MPRKWFIKTKAGPQGPVDCRILARLAAMGRLQPNSPVSHDGQSWIKAKRIAGIVFANTRSEPKEASEQEPRDERIQQTDPQRQLQFPLLADGQPLREVRRAGRANQLTLFACDPSPPIDEETSERRGGEQFPLFNWPARLVQLPLFDPALAAEADNTPPRQLELALVVAGEPFEESRQASPLHQLTLFAGLEPASIESAPIKATFIDQWPLFSWPPKTVQLRLFDPDFAVGIEQADHKSLRGPLRQLKLATFVDDEFRQQPRQLSLFSIDARPVEQAPPRETRLIDDWPLFHWPRRVVQLRLFDAANGHQPSSKQESARLAAVPSVLDIPRRLQQQWGEVRQAAYVARFGPFSHIARPQDPSGIPVGVYVFPPNAYRPVTTLVTSGMSNQPMPVPPGKCSPRAELILYVDQPQPQYVNLLYFLAQIPLQRNRVLRYGTAFSHGNPPRPILPGSVLDGYALMIPSVRSDFEIRQSARIADDPLQLLWVVPTTYAERSLLANNGMASFCRLLDQNAHTLLFDPDRRCYVSAASGHAG